jgi:hypothetical protein
MAVYRLRAEGTTPGETFTFGLHATGAGGTAADALTAWIAALTAMWTDVTDGIQAQFTADISIVAASAAELDPSSGHQLTRVEDAVTLPGTATGEPLPHEVAVVVSTRTDLATRRGRGRFYLPPLAVSKVDGGRVATTSVTNLLNGAVLLINTLQGGGYAPVIFHPDLTTTAINKVDVGDVFDVQRRRRNKLIEVRQTAGV